MLRSMSIELKLNSLAEGEFVSPGGFEINDIAFDFMDSSVEQNGDIYMFDLTYVDTMAFPDVVDLTSDDIRNNNFTEFYIDLESVSKGIEVEEVIAVSLEFYNEVDDGFEVVELSDEQLLIVNKLINGDSN